MPNPWSTFSGITVFGAFGKLFEFSSLSKLNLNQSSQKFEFTQGLSPIMAGLLVSEAKAEVQQLGSEGLFLVTLDSQKTVWRRPLYYSTGWTCSKMLAPHPRSRASLIQMWYKTTINLFLLSIDAICEIWKESASWLQRRCRLKMLTTPTVDGCLAIL